MGYDQQPILVPINDREYELLRNFTYEWEERADNDQDKRVVKRRLVIKAGFVTDIASVPQLCWSLGFTPDGLHRPAAVVHDLLYQYRGRLDGDQRRYTYEEYNEETSEWELVKRFYSRKECDKLFYRIMRESGTGRTKAYLMYKAVDWFGAKAW